MSISQVEIIDSNIDQAKEFLKKESQLQESKTFL